MPTRDDVLRLLAGIRDAETGRDIVASGFVKQMELKEDAVKLLLVPRNPTPERLEWFRKEVMSVLAPLRLNVSVDFTLAPQGQPTVTGLEQIRSVIAVASGKGGVGKSTVAIYTALALTKKGLKVALLDADIYGASAHIMLKPTEPIRSEGNRLIPPTIMGVKMMSMGYFAQTENPVIWRGPLVGKAVRDFIQLTEWGELDFLVVDLPPGCLAAGSRVLMADGTEVPVERIRKGDRIISFDEQGFSPAVVDDMIPQGKRMTYKIKTSRGELIATENHPFLVVSGSRLVWKSMGEVGRGDLVLCVVSGNTGAPGASSLATLQEVKVAVESVEPVGVMETYDLMVNRSHTFVANGYIVHNTGDAPLTLAQTLPVDGIILVTTPQEAAARVAAKSYYMFKKLGINVLGVVENMSYFICPHCGKSTHIFGEGGGRRLARELGIEFLGEIPLIPSLTTSGDSGIPLDIGAVSPSFAALAEKLVAISKKE